MTEPLNTQISYDRVAEEYSAHYLHELDHKPFDRDLLDRFAVQLKDKGRVADIGCGPGQIAAYLHKRGLDVTGIDLSGEMVSQAAKSHPGLLFMQGDMRALPLSDAELAGIAAFYSIIHIPRTGVTEVLREFRRVLKPGGMLLLTFHEGEEVRHFDEFLNQRVALDFFFFTREEMENNIREAGFEVAEILERDAYPDVEAQTHRVYILARKPDA